MEPRHDLPNHFKAETPALQKKRICLAAALASQVNTELGLPHLLARVRVRSLSARQAGRG